MCFLKPESIPFYALFLAPIVLVIVVNIVFFVMVAKVIKNSKSTGNISDQEQILVSSINSKTYYKVCKPNLYGILNPQKHTILPKN